MGDWDDGRDLRAHNFAWVVWASRVPLYQPCLGEIQMQINKEKKEKEKRRGKINERLLSAGPWRPNVPAQAILRAFPRPKVEYYQLGRKSPCVLSQF